ncbi:MAG: lactate permease, partial [Solirubrobacteraceae bacterium]|nr:lactate permease [Solirubrobacteraceae bacterium]
FGAIAIPITTLAQVTGLPKHDLSAMVGRQCPLIAVVLPLILIVIVDGRRGVREAWPAALTAGAVFAAVQFAASNYISPELTDILASLSSAACLMGLLRVWSPRPPATPVAARRPAIAGAAEHDAALERRVRADEGEPMPRADLIAAFAPYAIIIVVLGACSLHGIASQLETATSKFDWPGLHVLNAAGKAPASLVFKLNWLTAAGTQLLVAGILAAAVLRVAPARALAVYVRTLRLLLWPIVTVCAVLALAYVMNLSGQTITLGMWAAGAGGLFAFLSPLIGWFGTAVTGSDTSSNSLFGALQVAAARHAHLSPVLMAAANSSGGVLAKMVSPQNLAIGAAAVGLGGREGDIFRQVIGWSLVLVLAMAAIVLLQSTSVLSWMVP